MVSSDHRMISSSLVQLRLLMVTCCIGVLYLTLTISTIPSLTATTISTTTTTAAMDAPTWTKDALALAKTYQLFQQKHRLSHSATAMTVTTETKTTAAAAAAATTTTAVKLISPVCSGINQTKYNDDKTADRIVIQGVKVVDPTFPNTTTLILPKTRSSTNTNTTIHINIHIRPKNLKQPPLPIAAAHVATATNIAPATGRLRNDWSYNAPLSPMARMIQAYQTNCSLPVETLHLDNSFGIGAHVALWSQSICLAMEHKRRLRTYNPIWLWLDQTYCNMTVAATMSPWLCYLPGCEYQCGCHETISPTTGLNASDPRDKKRNECFYLKQAAVEAINNNQTTSNKLVDFRAASTEFLFHQISPLVIEEAQRQVGLLFANCTLNNSNNNHHHDDAVGIFVPHDLIAVHIRWGDKFWEMKLAVLSEYMQAISTILWDEFGHNRTANIYIATEDPKVYSELQALVPSGWNLFYDLTVTELRPYRPTRGNRASHMSKNTKGRAGLAGFGSLLVALEAKYFVLTTGSNWSRLMNQLRTQIIQPRCQNCTKMIDLRPGIW